MGISFDDYGFIQSRIALVEFLRNISAIKIVFSDAIDLKISKSLNKVLIDFQKNLVDLFKNDPENNDGKFFDCYFYSLPMLFLMIDNSDSSEKFIKQIQTLRHIGFNSQDFYLEYELVKRQFQQQ